MQSRLFLLSVSLLLFAAPASAFIRGDANQDETVNLTDAVFILNALFAPGAPQPDCEDVMDADDDGTLALGDAVYLLNALFQPGASPVPAPYPDGGDDLTLDALVSCEPVGGGGPQDLPMTEIASGSMSGWDMHLEIIIRTEMEWSFFWATHGGGLMPVIDFTEEMVIVILRSHFSGGYSVEITNVSEENGEIHVEYDYGQPIGFCLTILALTQPYHIVSVPAVDGDIVPEATIFDTCP